MGGGAWLRRNDAKSMPRTTPGAGGNGMHSSPRLQAAPLVLLGRNMLGIINIHFSYPGTSDSERKLKESPDKCILVLPQRRFPSLSELSQPASRSPGVPSCVCFRTAGASCFVSFLRAETLDHSCQASNSAPDRLFALGKIPNLAVPQPPSLMMRTMATVSVPFRP